MTHAEAAEYLDVCEKTIRRYEAGESNPKIPTLRALESHIVIYGGKPVPAQPDFTFVDLFAGIGGLRLGFEAIGGKCVFTSEWDKYSQKTYAANFPHDDHEIHDVSNT